MPEANDDLARLCSACGMCCDGSLFERVPLEPSEIEHVERMASRHRLVLVATASARALAQPCAAHVEEAHDTDLGVVSGRTCAIHGEHPLACKRFTCALHARHAREGGPLGPRLESVRRVRELVALLEASGFTADDLRTMDATAPLRAALAELDRRLEEDFARAPS